MTDFHPITPPPELAKEWLYEGYRQEYLQGDCTATGYALAQAARWGADQELEACASWVRDDDDLDTAVSLRAARRPLLSMKERALAKLPEQPENMASHLKLTPGDVATIRRALEQLDD